MAADMQTAICPTITAFDPHEFRHQMEVASSLSKRLHIDVMDGDFTPTKSPALEQIWWPHTVQADLHLMYKKPMDELEKIIKIQPELVIIHAEAEVHHMHFAGELHKNGIKAGLAILQSTQIEKIQDIMHSFDHILIFSGDLGRHGGKADLTLIDKVKKVREIYDDVEIGWDGGINEQVAEQLVAGGVDVLNIGGYVQDSDNPQNAYARIKKLIGR